MPTVVISSGSIPAVFPTRAFQGHVNMDGGTVWNTNLVSAVDRCLELVDSKSQIIVDIAICGHADIEPVTSLNNTVSNLGRYWDIRKYHSTMDDILEY